jgi:hypothetical protein
MNEEYNGWASPDSFHFYNWLTETEDRYVSAIECQSITELREFFKTQSDIPNGIDLNEVNWFELWDTLHQEN